MKEILSPPSSRMLPDALLVNHNISNSININHGNIQQQRKRISQTIQYSPILDGMDHDTVGATLCSVIQVLNDTPTTTNHSIGSATNNSSYERINHAITKVMIWKNRVVSQHLAHAIDCTVSIAQVLLRDLYYTTSTSTSTSKISSSSSSNYTNQPPPSTITTITTTNMSSNELRHLYSSIIVRCINGFADLFQQQRSVATSIANLCREIGIPSYIVTIRHEATHNQLPSLGILRMVAQTLLEYLQNVYWIPKQQQHYELPHQRAQEILHYYEMVISQNQKLEVVKQPPPIRQSSVIESVDTVDYNAKRGEGDVHDNDDDDSIDDEIIIDGLFQSLPGTTSNRFAALLSEKDTKKTNTPKPPSQPLPPQEHQGIQTPRRKKQKTERNVMNYQITNNDTNCNKDPNIRDQHPPSPRLTVAICSKAYVQLTSNQVSIDLLQRIAINHIIQKTRLYVTDDNSNINDNVATVGVNAAQQPQRRRYAQFLHRYRPLLGSMARIWPGFCARFLSHCVQEIIQCDHSTDHHHHNHSETNYDFETCHTPIVPMLHVERYPLYGILLEGWIHLLLSNNFLQQIDIPLPSPISSNISKSLPVDTGIVATTTNGSKYKCTVNVTSSLIFKTENCIGSLGLFRKLQYPLNRLCDVLVASLGGSELCSASNSTRRQIVDLFLMVLGEERTLHYGIDELQQSYHRISNDIPNVAVQQVDDNITTDSVAVAPATTSITTVLSPQETKSTKMSLEDMEALLLNVTATGISTKHLTDDDRNKKHSVNDNTDDDYDTHKNHNDGTCTTVHTKEQNDVTPRILVSKWIQCTTWEPCAIGTTLG